MNETIEGLKRTHMCGELRKEHLNEIVTLMGWVQKRRNLGGLIFVDLRDRTGIIQIVFDEKVYKDIFEKAEAIRNEYVLAVIGSVRERGEDAVNSSMVTGEIEVLVNELRILNVSETPPIYINEDSDVNEKTRLKYRYLDLRRPDMQKNIILRHKVSKMVRDYFDSKGFLEIETPVLTKSTPEGARDYLVPSRVQPGKFFALPQSPQLYKQLLMLSGMDRYFQIVKCFRDEDLRADRQPEFTQIDLEMSFVDIDDVLSINEELISKIFSEILKIELPTPLLRLSYQEAMDRYGADNPDIRFGLELIDVSDIVANSGFKVFSGAVENGGSVRIINAKSAAEKLSRRDLDGLTEHVKTYGAKGMAWIIVTENELKSSFTKFLTQDEIDAILKRANAEPGDVIMAVADKNSVVYSALGHLRLELGKRFGLIDKSDFKALWVTDFPLLEYDEEEKRFVAKHHPFTSPVYDDIPLLDTNPEVVRARAYDMVINGMEVGGGSIRIHDSNLQEKMFEVLGFSKEEAKEKFGFLMDAFKFGAPPHGGMAYGLDRLVMIIAGKDSIRDVIAFPKLQNSSEAMIDSPSEVEKKQLDELSIALNISEEDAGIKSKE